MEQLTVLVLAVALDALIGDPRWLPHPIRGIGMVITFGETRLRQSSALTLSEFWRGALLVSLIVIGTYLLTALVLTALTLWSWWIGIGATILLGATCLARRDLKEHALAVSDALIKRDLVSARTLLARMVSRDTMKLPEPEVIRGTIESVAENSSDGVIAPLLYMAIGGVPLAMAYKAVNTLDSMIGYRTERYEQFGKVAARLDDVVNFLPARVSALAIVGAAWIGRLYGRLYDEKMAWRITWRDGHKHESPNAGYPEAAMAGALGVQLGGPGRYFGITVEKPTLGDEENSLQGEHITQSLYILDLASILTLLGVLMVVCGLRIAT